jgi:hypothetical protein
MPSKPAVTVSIVLAVSAALVTAAFATPPAMSTRWTGTTLSKEECVEKGSRALRAEGFTKGFEVVNTTVFGERGDYTAAVRCATEKEIVFFVVAGPVAKQASSYNANIAGRFDE